MLRFPTDSEYEYNVQAQITALREYEATKPGRGIPDKASDRLLLATWNIANLGWPAQDRRAKDLMVIAELISWFDLVVVQKVNDDLSGLRGSHAAEQPFSLERKNRVGLLTPERSHNSDRSSGCLSESQSSSESPFWLSAW